MCSAYQQPLLPASSCGARLQHQNVAFAALEGSFASNDNLKHLQLAAACASIFYFQCLPVVFALCSTCVRQCSCFPTIDKPVFALRLTAVVGLQSCCNFQPQLKATLQLHLHQYVSQAQSVGFLAVTKVNTCKLNTCK